MTTTASKVFLGGSFFAMIGAWVYGWGTGGGLTGVMLFGLKGGVGELTGYTILASAAFVLACLGTATAILRDADPERQAVIAHLDVAPLVTAPSAPSYWPVVGAVAAVAAIVGLVASPVLFVIGALGVLLVALEWMVTAWSERATGDPEVNRQIRNRLMFPIEIPVAGALVILVVVVSISRVLLSLDRNVSSAVGIAIAATILLTAFAIAYRPKVSKNVVAGILAVGAVAAIGAGIAAAAAGSREFEVHEEEHGGAGGEESEQGAASLSTVEVPEAAS